MSAFAGFSLSRFYSTQAPSIGDGATHSEDESSQPLVNLLCKHPHTSSVWCFTNVLGVSQFTQVDNPVAT